MQYIKYFKRRKSIMIRVLDISYDDIKVIKKLWEKNRQYHEINSQYFNDLYRSINFEQRMKALEGFDKDKMIITVAKNNDEYMGYCISIINDGKGEIESLHVDESYRRNGIGKELVVKHIKWMKERNCHTIGVTVSQENESTISFYKKLGLYPNTLYMQLK